MDAEAEIRIGGGEIPIRMTMGRPCPTLVYAGEGEPEPVSLGNMVFYLYHGRTPDGERALSAEAVIDGVACAFTIEGPRENLGTMKQDLELVLAYFAEGGNLNWEVLPPVVPELQ